MVRLSRPARDQNARESRPIHAPYRDCGLQENRKQSPAIALSVHGLIYDLEDARKAGVKLGEVRTSDGVPAILAQWHGNADLARACEELAQLARSGKLQAVAGGMAALTAPFHPERMLVPRPTTLSTPTRWEACLQARRTANHTCSLS